MAGWAPAKYARGLAVGTTVWAGVVLWAPLVASVASADTLEGSLILAYQNNPSLNSQRASV